MYLLEVQGAALQSVWVANHTGNFFFAQTAQNVVLTNLTLLRTVSLEQHVIAVTGVQNLEIT